MLAMRQARQSSWHYFIALFNSSVGWAISSHHKPKSCYKSSYSISTCPLCAMVSPPIKQGLKFYGKQLHSKTSWRYNINRCEF